MGAVEDHQARIFDPRHELVQFLEGVDASIALDPIEGLECRRGAREDVRLLPLDDLQHVRDELIQLVARAERLRVALADLPAVGHFFSRRVRIGFDEGGEVVDAGE